jgi:hypothetical protein
MAVHASGRVVVMTAGLYEQLKDDLGYLHLEHAAETLATLAETATRQDWTHIQFLAELIGDQAAATRNRRLTAGCATPGSRFGAPSTSSTSRLRQNPPRGRVGHPRRRSRLAWLLHHRRRHDPHPSCAHRSKATGRPS